ncbi:MAG TPA: Mechanosensitive ion channel [Microscillaceae bacterium]|nr:Mechanosensitive ion channel [Microscillaceae bacterium]
MADSTNPLLPLSLHQIRKKVLTTTEQVYIFVRLGLFLGLMVVKFYYKTYLKAHDLEHYVDALSFYLTAHLVLDAVRILFVRVYSARTQIAEFHRDNFLLGVRQIYSLLLFIIGVFSAFIFFRIAIREFFTSISIVAAALALLSKDYISNMINGMILMFSDRLSLGDYVKIGQHKGRIVDITLLNIQMASDDDEFVYIPNNMVLSTEFVNYSKKSANRISIEFEVAYTHLQDLGLLEQQLIEALSEYQQFIKPQSYNLKTGAIFKDAAILKFQYEILEPNTDMEYKIRRIVARKVIDYMHDSTTIFTRAGKSSLD